MTSTSPAHPKARKLLRLQAHQSSEIGAVNSPRSAAKRPSYVFFVEIITKGAVDKGGRCPDGTITVARAGNDLALFWFGSIEANTIVAYGTLSKK